MEFPVETIYRYPVKGLSAQALDTVAVSEDQAIPNDRRFALALGSTQADRAATEWMSKSHFLMLQRNEKLVQLQTEFDDTTDILTIFRNGKQVTRGKLTQAIGRTVIEDFFSAFMGDEARGEPKIVEAASGRTISDHAAPVLSMINLASVRDIERITGKAVDPLRFRANIYFDADEPWVEFTWTDRELAIGEARFVVESRIDRCAATSVNPATAERDLNVVKALQQGFGHIDCGVYLSVTKAGAISVGDPISPSSFFGRLRRRLTGFTGSSAGSCRELSALAASTATSDCSATGDASAPVSSCFSAATGSRFFSGLGCSPPAAACCGPLPPDRFSKRSRRPCWFAPWALPPWPSALAIR